MRRDPPQWSRVEVVWHDATVTPDWQERAELEQERLIACLTATTKQAVGPTISIPRKWISSVKRIGRSTIIRDPWADEAKGPKHARR